jgi:hypothetical protein
VDILTDKVSLLSLVEGARRGHLALPQFQRNFVWPRDQVADLLLSIIKGYFIGSFLLMRNDPDTSPFAARTIAGVTRDSDNLRPEKLVLDGQQRLTSLHYVMAGPDIPLKWTKHPYRFFLDLNKLAADDDDGLIFSLRFDNCSELLAENGQFTRRIVPFTEIPRWAEWKDRFEDWLFDTNREEHGRYRAELRPIWNQKLGALTAFQVPVIELPKISEGDEKGIGEVCAIFEKLNSTGVLLSVYDLLTARLYKYSIDVHKLWQTSSDMHAQIHEFSGGEPDTYGIFVLRVIALLRGLEVKARQLINLKPQNFEEDWRRAAEAIEKALKRLVSIHTDGFGVFDPRWQPYSTLIPVLATCLSKGEEARIGEGVYRDLKCWYWGSVFLERYAGAVESTTYRDAIDLLRRQREPEFRPQVFEDIKTLLLDPKYSVRDVARVNSVYRGVMNLVAINGARDFATNDGIPFHELEDHHIFPGAFLRDKLNIKGARANTILNRTLIKDSTNRKISRKAPSEYLRTVLPIDHRETILRSHLIGEAAQAAMERDDYEAFLAAREQDILANLRNYLQPAA